MDKLLSELGYLSTIGCYSAIIWNKLLIYARTWMVLRKSQFLKVAYFIPFVQYYQSDKMAEMEHRTVVFQISGV